MKRLIARSWMGLSASLLVMAGLPTEQASATWDGTVTCSNIPSIPSSIQCSNLPTIPACPAVPKQVDFRTEVPNLSALPIKYGFRLGRVPHGGEPNYAGGNNTQVSYSRKLEKSGSASYVVHEWKVQINPSVYNLIVEVIRYIEYPGYPRSPEVQDLLFDQVNPAMADIYSEASNRYRYLRLACKTAAYEATVSSPASSAKYYYYLLSNHPSAKTLVDSKSLAAQNCEIVSYEDSPYTVAGFGKLPQHEGPVQ